MKLNRNVFVFSLILSLLPSVSLADINSKMGDWFGDQDFSNVTPAGVYEGQSSNTVSFGGISTRNRVVQPFNFVTVDTPRFSAGCGGIDMYLGGFSAVNADQFVQNLRAIGQNAQSLAFMLALQVVSPQLTSIMDKVNTYAQKFNFGNIDSCDAASELVGGVYKKFGTQKSTCITNRMDTNGEDFQTASWNCTTGGRKKETDDVNGGNAANKLSFQRGNLAWYIMMGNPLFRGDHEFSQLMMNLVGTLIVVPSSAANDAGVRPRIVPPALDDEGNLSDIGFQIHDALLLGSSAQADLEIFKCVGTTSSAREGCQTITDTKTNIPRTWKGLHGSVKESLDSIIDKVANDTRLNATEIGIIETTSIPVYQLITSIAAQKGRSANGLSLAKRELDDYAQFIAKAILYENLMTYLSSMERSALDLPDGISLDADIMGYVDDIKLVREGVGALEKANRISAKEFNDIQEKITKYESEILANLGTDFMRNVGFTQ